MMDAQGLTRKSTNFSESKLFILQIFVQEVHDTPQVHIQMIFKKKQQKKLNVLRIAFHHDFRILFYCLKNQHN